MQQQPVAMASNRTFGKPSYRDDKTNNEAEYIALVGGLRKAAQLGIRVLNVKGDSSLVVNQVNGTWKVKTDHLRPMFEEARRIIDENFDGGASLAYVRRELNSEADSLANVAITAAAKLGISPYPFALAVVIAASAAYSTPVASPVVTLVVEPGRYRFMDFVKTGVPLLLLTYLVTLMIAPLIFPYSG